MAISTGFNNMVILFLFCICFNFFGHFLNTSAYGIVSKTVKDLNIYPAYKLTN